LARKGLTPASFVPEASGGRLEEASIKPARLLEGTRLEAIAVGPAEAWPAPLAYLDGIQRSEVVGYHGSSPILAAEIAAAVRERHDRRLHTATQKSPSWSWPDLRRSPLPGMHSSIASRSRCRTTMPRIPCATC
jgi:hypothetical protein